MKCTIALTGAFAATLATSSLVQTRSPKRGIAYDLDATGDHAAGVS